MPSIAGVKAGNAYVVIGALDDTGKMLSKIGRSIKKWGQGLSNLGLDMLFKGALLAAPGVAMLRWAVDFDDNMTSVAAKIGATNAEMNTLRKTAMTAGNDIGMTAKQMSEIMLELSTRDFDAAAINEMTRPIALLAKATGKGNDSDTKQAAALLSQTLQAFHMDAGQAAIVADKMTIAANKSNFALDDLAVAMSHVAPIAAQMNVSLDETIAVMAVMRNVGIEAESAAIGLRNIMLRTTDPKKGKDFNDTMQAMGLGIVEFSDKAGNLKTPAKMLAEVFDRIKGLGTAAQGHVLSELFGLRAIVPAAAAGQGGKGIEDMMKALEAAGGDAEKIAKEMEKGLGGSFRKIRNGVETLAISMGDVLRPMIASLSTSISGLLKNMIAWVNANPRAAASIATITIGVLALGSALIVLGLTIKTVGFAIGSLGFILTGLKLALSAVVIAFSVGFTIISTVLGVIPPILTLIVTLFTGLVGAIWTIVTAAVSFVASIAGIPAAIIAGLVVVLLLLAAGVGAIMFMGNAFKMIWNIGVGAFQAMLGAAQQFKNFVMGTWAQIAQTAIGIFGVIQEGLGAAFQLAAVGKFQLGMEVAIASMTLSWIAFRNTLLKVWDDIYAYIATIINKISAGIKIFILESQALMAKFGLAVMVDRGEMTAEEANRQAAMIDAGVAAGKAGLRGGANVKPDQAAQERRADEHRNAVNAFDAIMKKVAPDLKDPKLIFEDLKKKIMDAFAPGKIGGMPLPAGAGGKPPQALVGLERGSLEAAKAAYDASVAGEMNNDLQAQQLAAQQQIADNTSVIALNLGVA